MSSLVTGANGAIGSAIVDLLLADGETVIAQDLRPNDREGQVIAVAGDLLDTGTQRAIRAACDEHHVERVIAAHGIDGSGALDAVSSDDITRVLAINAESVLSLFATVRSALERTNGAFVIVSSQAGLTAEPNNVAYSASKFALVGWARAMRAAMQSVGVRLRVLAPGCTETPLLIAAQQRFADATGTPADDFLQQRRAGIPMQRFASTAETAAGAIYLSERRRPTPFVLAATGGEVLH